MLKAIFSDSSLAEILVLLFEENPCVLSLLRKLTHNGH
jgi:hypothetical protein